MQFQEHCRAENNTSICGKAKRLEIELPCLLFSQLHGSKKHTLKLGMYRTKSLKFNSEIIVFLHQVSEPGPLFFVSTRMATTLITSDNECSILEICKLKAPCSSKCSICNHTLSTLPWCDWQIPPSSHIPTLQPQTRGLSVIILTEEPTQDPKDATISLVCYTMVVQAGGHLTSPHFEMVTFS